jgi:hypothetical protein
MGILRVYVVVLLVGWFTWFLLEKPTDAAGVGPVAAPQYGPYALPLPERPTMSRIPPPPPEGDTIADFQYAVDMTKQGEFQRAFVTLWRRQYWLSAAVLTALFMTLAPPVSRAIKRLRTPDRRR